MLRDGLRQRLKACLRFLVSFNLKNRFPVVLESRSTLYGGGVSFISEIVCAAGEAIDVRHGSAQSLGQQQGGDRKVLVVVNGHVKKVF